MKFWFLLLAISPLFSLTAQDSLNIDSRNLTLTSSPKSDLFYLTSSFLVPGLGQFMLGHKFEGPFVFTMELLLLSSGANDGFYLTSKWNNRITAVQGQLKGPFDTHNRNFLETMISEDSLTLTDSLEYYRGEYEYSRAIRDRTLVWAAGFHVFNVLDCYHYLSRAKGRDETRSPGGALIRSFVLPGWGQFYNHEYSKLGLLIMSTAGFSTNIFVWNRAAGYYQGLEGKYHGLFLRSARSLVSVEAALAQSGQGLSAIETSLKDTTLSEQARDSLLDDKNAFSASRALENRRYDALSADRSYFSTREGWYDEEKKTYLSKRNQNIWYLFALYLYTAFDAYVDASVSNIDKRLEFSLLPLPQEGLEFSMKINLK
jgi:hypothetical protein